MARKKKEPTNELRGKDGPDDHAISTAITACVMGVPVDPDDGYPQDQVAGLREEIQAMMARGTIFDIPTSIDDFDPDEFKED